MTSILNVDTIAAKDGTSPVALTKQSAAKSTIVYDQTVPSITGSFNISSLTDNATGRATLDFINNKSAVDYSAVNGAGQKAANNSGRRGEVNPFSASQYEHFASNHAGTAGDYTANSVVTFGDLA